MAIPADGNMQKEPEKKIQKFVYTNTTNVEHEMYDYTNYNWSHQKSNKRFKENFGDHTQKTSNRYTNQNKTATSETSHTIRKVLQSETEA